VGVKRRRRAPKGGDRRGEGKGKGAGGCTGDSGVCVCVCVGCVSAWRLVGSIPAVGWPWAFLWDHKHPHTPPPTHTNHTHARTHIPETCTQLRTPTCAYIHTQAHTPSSGPPLQKGRVCNNNIRMMHLTPWVAASKHGGDRSAHRHASSTRRPNTPCLGFPPTRGVEARDGRIGPSRAGMGPRDTTAGDAICRSGGVYGWARARRLGGGGRG